MFLIKQSVVKMLKFCIIEYVVRTMKWHKAVIKG
jgi:hypothetical protein